MTLGPVPPASDRLIRLERTLQRVRWFGIALGVYLTFWYEPNPGTTTPESMYVFSGIALGVLTASNVAGHLILRRMPDEPTLRRLGATTFLLDMAAVWTIVWAFTFEQYGATWVVLAILCLEGAVRYELRGALLPVALAVPIESAREIFRHVSMGFDLFASSVVFRVGFIAMIAYVAGTMARNMERERRAAEESVERLQRAAERERAARSESIAFQKVILAGVQEEGMEAALRSMLRHVAADLGYTRSVVLMIEGDGILRPITAHGFSAGVLEKSVTIGQGIAGSVALTGATEIIADVSQDPRYFEIDPSTRAQITVPIRVGDQVIGILECESHDLGAFDETDARRLERLSDQMGLIIENARLLSQERAAVERLRELDIMKSDFIAIASHELRTPLTAIQGSLKTLRRPDLRLSTEELWTFIDILDRQSDRLTRLVEDLLLVSRIDHGGVGLRMETMRVESTMQDVLAELGERAGRVSLAVDPGLPPVVSDPQRIGQIARNLLENGIKFSGDDTLVRLNVRSDGDVLEMEVSDDGVGIPAAELGTIFDRFHQVGGSMRRRGDGFGLGLYITKRLVEALQGTITVRSTPGKGTTFRVRLPLVAAESGRTGIA